MIPLMEEFAIFRNYQKALAYNDQQRKDVNWRLSAAVKQVELEPENLDHDFTAREQFTEDPETIAQLCHLEKYGYFYK